MTRWTLLVLALTIAAVIESTSARISPALVAAGVAICAALLAAPRRPLAMAVAQASAISAIGAAGHEPSATAAVLALMLGAGAAAQASRTVALAALAIYGGGDVASLALLGAPEDTGWVFGVFTLAPWTAGRLIAGRRARLAELEALTGRLAAERRRGATLAAEVERARIARDIEVVLRDALRDIVVRADAAAAAEQPPPGTFEALQARGAEAMRELRRLLRLLHA